MKITEFKSKDFRGSNALWDYMVVNASFKSYIIRHDQLGFSRLNYKKKKGGENIHNVINNKMTEFNHGACSWIQCLADLHGC